MGRSITGWILPIVLMGWLAALPDAYTRRHIGDILDLVLGPNGVDLEMASGLGYAALVAELGKLILDLVALQWAFTVMADVAAGRPVSLFGGLRRMASWKLQFSWLVSGTLVSIGTGVWYVGGCLLLLPFGFAVAEAYEQQNGMGAIKESARLGFLKGPTGVRLAMPMVWVSTGLLASALVLSCGFDVGGLFASSGVDDAALTRLMGELDSADPEALLRAIVHALFPVPSWASTIWTILSSPARQFIEVALLAIQLVAYHHARTLVPAEAVVPTS